MWIRDIQGLEKINIQLELQLTVFYPVQERIFSSITGSYSTVQVGTVQYMQVQQCTGRYSTLQVFTLQVGTDTVQVGTVKYRQVHYSTGRYNTVQVGTVLYRQLQYITGSTSILQVGISFHYRYNTVYHKNVNSTVHKIIQKANCEFYLFIFLFIILIWKSFFFLIFFGLLLHYCYN